METVLVTGATGNVGREVVNALVGKAQVRAAVLPSELYRMPAQADVTYTAFDFLNPASFAPALAGVTRLFLLRPPALANARQHFAPIIEAAKAAGVRHIVFLSLMGVERNPFVPHHAIEMLLRASGMTWTFLRASFFMQNLSTTHRDEIRNRHELFIPAGKSRTSFVDTRDIGAVAARVLMEEGHSYQCYTLTGSEALTYREVADTFSSELGVQVRYANPSLWAFIRYQRERKTPWVYTLVMAMLYSMTRTGTASLVSDDCARLLGKAPIALREYVHEYRQNWT